MRARCSGAMPMPVSVTTYSMSAPATRTSSVTVPSFVNLIAFDRRLSRIWRSFVKSVRQSHGARRNVVTSASPLIAAIGSASAAVSRATTHASPAARRVRPRARPRVARAKESRRSARAVLAAAPDSRELHRAAAPFTGPVMPSIIRLEKPRMALSGVRSSCDITARKSLFAWLASTASRRADSASARCCSLAARDSDTRSAMRLNASPRRPSSSPVGDAHATLVLARRQIVRCRGQLRERLRDLRLMQPREQCADATSVTNAIKLMRCMKARGGPDTAERGMAIWTTHGVRGNSGLRPEHVAGDADPDT